MSRSESLALEAKASFMSGRRRLTEAGRFVHLCFARTTAPRRFLLFLTSPATVNTNDEVTVKAGGLNGSTQHSAQTHIQ